MLKFIYIYILQWIHMEHAHYKEKLNKWNRNDLFWQAYNSASKQYYWGVRVIIMLIWWAYNRMS